MKVLDWPHTITVLNLISPEGLLLSTCWASNLYNLGDAFYQNEGVLGDEGRNNVFKTLLLEYI